jgi:sugar O-acyltransferase (sialic acid O-acetyltransferase NeuD family)
MQNIVIYGAGDLAKLAYFYAKQELGINVLGFVVDDGYLIEKQFLDLPVFTWSQCPTHHEAKMFVAFGYKSMRARMYAYTKAKSAGYQLVNLISKQSHLASNVRIGDNNIIMAGVIVEPFSELGSNNVVWSNATICHDSKIGNHNFFAANATIGGKVNVGNQCFFGFSSTVIQNLTVEDEVLLAAGSLAITRLCSLSLYVGLPAVLKNSLNTAIGVSID